MSNLLRIFVLLIACVPCGCRLFDDAAAESDDSMKNELPPIQAAPESIELEIGHIRRLADDPLLGDALWQHVNQVVAGDDEMSRRQIRQNGFRVGVTAAHPPDALVRLLKPALDNTTPSGEPITTAMQAIAIRDGGTTEVVASPYFKHCRIRFPDRSGDQYREFELAQGKYQIRVHKVQDGWVELHFTPVMQHSDVKTRHTAAPNGHFAIQTGQERKVFHTRRFKVRVMVGEWVVIGGNPDDPGTLGHQFYFGPEADDWELQEYRRRVREQTEEQQGDDASKPLPVPESEDEAQFQRLLVLRVANMKPAIVQ